MDYYLMHKAKESIQSKWKELSNKLLGDHNSWEELDDDELDYALQAIYDFMADNNLPIDR